MHSYQNLIILQYLYKIQTLGFSYIEHFQPNQENFLEEVSSLDELTQSIHSCHLCDLSKTRKQSMGGYGNQYSDIMILDYVVSIEQEDMQDYYGGRGGELLNNMIKDILQKNKEDIFYTHCVKCKVFDKKDMIQMAYNSCQSYLYTQINLIKPKIIIVLGKEAYEIFTNDKGNFENVRGHIVDFSSYKIFPIYHPEYLLRNPKLQQITKKDLQRVQTFIKI